MSQIVQKSGSRSIGQRRWQKFKTIKRGYYSLVILTTMYILSFLLPILVNDKALIVRYNGEYHFPAFTSLVASFPVIDQFVSVFQSGESLGQVGNPGQVRYRDLQQQYKNENGDNYVVMPIYPYGPIEDITTDGNSAFMEPMVAEEGQTARIMGTDENGRDVFARMAYGFKVSISFALILVFLEYLIG